MAGGRSPRDLEHSPRRIGGCGAGRPGDADPPLGEARILAGVPPPRSPSRSPALGCGAVAAGVALALAAALLIYVVADHVAGRLAGGFGVAGLFALPLVVGVGCERLALALGREVRAERVALWLTPLLSLAVLALAFSLGRVTTGEALVRAPERYSWLAGPLGGVVRRAGGWLGHGPDAEPAPPGPAPGPSEGPSAAPQAPPKADVPDAAPLYASGDTSYREEPTCVALTDVSELARSYAPGARRKAALGLSTSRYPAGGTFIEAQDDRALGAWFLAAPDSFDGTGSRLDTVIHEGSHIWSAKRFRPGIQVYSVRSDLSIEAKRLKNFLRSEILEVHVDRAADTYAKTYLEGASGAQGLNTLLDEYNAYAHSLASRYCTRDFVGPGMRVSARDGILTFMYYVEAYLGLARERHTRDYEAILADPGHRRLILTVWDRAEFWLRQSAHEPNLGISDETIRGWVYVPERLEEIARVRRAHAAAK